MNRNRENKKKYGFVKRNEILSFGRSCSFILTLWNETLNNIEWFNMHHIIFVYFLFFSNIFDGLYCIFLLSALSNIHQYKWTKFFFAILKKRCMRHAFFFLLIFIAFVYSCYVVTLPIVIVLVFVGSQQCKRLYCCCYFCSCCCFCWWWWYVFVT